MTEPTAKQTETVYENILDKVAQATLDKVIAKGDCSSLSETERGVHYRTVCESLGLNAITEPFKYLQLNGKLQIYATKSATDQLRRKYEISICEMTEENRADVYIVTATAQTPSGRTDKAKGAVTIANLKGDALANAIMKAETKAKRRVTLSICGLGMLDESEIETIPGAHIEPAKIEQPDVAAKAAEVKSIVDTAALVDFYKSQPLAVKSDPKFIAALAARKLEIINGVIDELAGQLGYGSVEVGMIATEMEIDMEKMSAAQAEKLAARLRLELSNREEVVI